MHTPSTAIIGIRPEEITHGTFMGNLLKTIKGADMIECINRRRETTMQAEDLRFNEGGKGKIVEQVSEELPYVSIAVFSETFIIESVYL